MQTPKEHKVSPSTVAWCTCGFSMNYPICDGSHVSTENKPKIETVSEGKTVHICMCGKSKNKPFCDGSHLNMEENETEK